MQVGVYPRPSTKYDINELKCGYGINMMDRVGDGKYAELKQLVTEFQDGVAPIVGTNWFDSFVKINPYYWNKQGKHRNGMPSLHLSKVRNDAFHSLPINMLPLVYNWEQKFVRSIKLALHSKCVKLLLLMANDFQKLKQFARDGHRDFTDAHMQLIHAVGTAVSNGRDPNVPLPEYVHRGALLSNAHGLVDTVVYGLKLGLARTWSECRKSVNRGDYFDKLVTRVVTAALLQFPLNEQLPKPTSSCAPLGNPRGQTVRNLHFPRCPGASSATRMGPRSFAQDSTPTTHTYDATIKGLVVEKLPIARLSADKVLGHSRGYGQYLMTKAPGVLSFFAIYQGTVPEYETIDALGSLSETCSTISFSIGGGTIADESIKYEYNKKTREMLRDGVMQARYVYIPAEDQELVHLFMKLF